MIKPAIALCLLVQVCAADPELTLSMRASATYETYLDQDGTGYQLAVGAGLAMGDKLVGVEVAVSDYDSRNAPGQTLHHAARGIYLAGERHFGPIGLGLALGMAHHEITREFADGTAPEPDEVVWRPAARISVGVTVVTIDQHALEIVAAVERVPSGDPDTTLFFGLGYRFTGGF